MTTQTEAEARVFAAAFAAVIGVGFGVNPANDFATRAVLAFRETQTKAEKERE